MELLSSNHIHLKKRKKKLLLSLAMFGALLAALSPSLFLFKSDLLPFSGNSIKKKAFAAQLGRRFQPSHAVVSEQNFELELSLDENLQRTAEKLLRQSRVPYTALVAMEADTGRILAMTSRGLKNENLALRATFPAASVFKIVTAAAALEMGILQHDSLIPVRGSFHTLYRGNVLAAGGLSAGDAENQIRRPHYARLIRFEDALAKSVNSVFGKVGLFGVGSNTLRKVADLFQFQRDIPFDLPVDTSRAFVPEEGFGIAESASGFNRVNTLSPLHGALIAAAVANDGIMMEPSLISKASSEGRLVYEMTPRALSRVMSKKTAEQLAIMMNRTIVAGTSSRAFYAHERVQSLEGVFLGGKTGTLNGDNPVGRYDWFVGFGMRGSKKIAIATLCIHGSRRGMRASQISRHALEAFFGSLVAQKNLPAPQRET